MIFLFLSVDKYFFGWILFEISEFIDEYLQFSSSFCLLPHLLF